MIRVLLINALLFLLPFALTYLWVRFIAAKKPDEQTGKYYAFSALAGLGLVVASLLAYRASSGDAPGGTYISPSYKDGQIVPGRFE
jgi:uncharacterized membrane protein